MIDSVRKELRSGVSLTYLHSKKFKTGTLGVQLITPLSKKDAAFGALLPSVLRRGTTRHTDMRALACALDTLYGASVECTVRKKGENQCLGFLASFIDDAFVPGGESLLEPMAELLSELLLEPLTKNGRFLPQYVEGEKENLIETIESILNDKRDYADMRLLQEMCKNERYGIDKFGTVEDVKKITNQTLYRYYRELLSHAQAEFFYCGSAALRDVEAVIERAFALLPRGEIAPIAEADFCSAPEEPRYLRESLDVTQGKLAMGWRANTHDTAAMMLTNVLFGGYSNSKLFLNVREKLSLCYFASSSYHRSKGLVTVSSGIEFADYERALNEIFAQLEAIRNGEIEPWEIEGAKSCLISAIRSREDSAGRLEEYYLGQAATGLFESAEVLMRELAAVDIPRIRACAQAMELDTVYFLTGKEEQNERN